MMISHSVSELVGALSLVSRLGTLDPQAATAPAGGNIADSSAFSERADTLREDFSNLEFRQSRVVLDSRLLACLETPTNEPTASDPVARSDQDFWLRELGGSQENGVSVLRIAVYVEPGKLDSVLSSLSEALCPSMVHAGANLLLYHHFPLTKLQDLMVLEGIASIAPVLPGNR